MRCIIKQPQFTYGNIFPLAECDNEMNVRQQIDNMDHPNFPRTFSQTDIQQRFQWLVKVKNANQLEFLQLRKNGCNYFFYRTHGAILALQDEALFQRWLELEQLLSERQLVFFKSELKDICKYYNIDLGRNRNSFKFPHLEQAIPTNDANICRDLAKHGFPNVRAIPFVSPYDVAIIREYARVLEPEESIHVAVMVPMEML